MKEYDMRPCCVCGELFTPKRVNSRTCGNPECKKQARHEQQKKWYRENCLKARGSRKAYMRRIRAEARTGSSCAEKPRDIVAIGYAERQIARSLELAGKIKTEL